MKNDKEYQKRLNELIVNDNNEGVNVLEKLVKAEITSVLKNYFIISSEDIDIDLSAVVGGCYKININGDIKGVKKIKKLCLN